MATNRLQITELDFLRIKENLKTFLKTQSEFSDYDFEGSGLSILLDILAYNTHYNAYYLNMVANEAFMDSAVLRDSVVSHSKTLGYVPHSKKAAKAVINLTAQAAVVSNSTVTIPRGFEFTSEVVDSQTYRFCLLEEKTATKVNGNYYFEDLNIFQGNFVEYSYTYDTTTNPKAIFTIEDENVDISTLKVLVQQNYGNNTVEIFTNAEDETDVDGTSAVYFLQETMGRKFQIYFGSGYVGKAINDGAIVNLSYLVTDGDAANKLRSFYAAEDLPGVESFTVELVSASSGGSEVQSVDEIKQAALSRYTSQNRLVTTNDYESYIKKKYPNIDSLSIWGGEDEIPKVFGKVYVSLKPKTGYYISEFEKKEIINNIIKPKSIVSIDSEIRDPSYLYILLQTNIQYSRNKTILTPEQIKSLVRNQILSYNSNNLNKFRASVIVSRLQDIIDSSDNSILGNQTRIFLQKRFIPSLRTSNTYEIDFGVPIQKGTTTRKLQSTQFRVRDKTNNLRDVILEEVPGSDSGITRIDVVNPGFGYIIEPAVTIVGDGYGAEAVAKIKNGRIETIELTKRGYGYSRATVTLGGGFNNVSTNIFLELPNRATFRSFSLQQKAGLYNLLLNKGYTEDRIKYAFDTLGGRQTEEQWQSVKILAVEQANTTVQIETSQVLNTVGTGRMAASAAAVIDSKIGDLQTVYFTNKSERVIVNDKVGTIDYTTGKITLRDLNIQGLVDTDQTTININAESENGIIESIKNTLLTIDENDPNSIEIIVQPV